MRPATCDCIEVNVPKEKRIKVIIAKLGLDGHDRGAKLLCRVLAESGMEVVYTGLRQTPEMIVETALQEASERLPVRVTGEVHWSVVRIDPTHVRVILVGPGYLTPADRDAEILLQHLDGTNCIDILSGEILPIKNKRIRVHAPMGIARIMDELCSSHGAYSCLVHHCEFSHLAILSSDQ